MYMLNHRQIRTLRKIRKEQITRTSKLNEDIDYFCQLGLVVACEYDTPDDYMLHPRLTELGKAVLPQVIRAEWERWLPIGISLASLIISIIALLK